MRRRFLRSLCVPRGRATIPAVQKKYIMMTLATMTKRARTKMLTKTMIGDPFDDDGDNDPPDLPGLLAVPEAALQSSSSTGLVAVQPTRRARRRTAAAVRSSSASGR